MHLILLFLLCATPSLCEYVVDTHDVLPSGHGLAGEASWYLFQYGPNYAQHRKPYRIYTKQCKNFVAVSWTSVQWSNQRMTGHVTLFKTQSQPGRYSVVVNREFSDMETMHDLAWNDDCSKLYVLGKTPWERAPSVSSRYNLISKFPGIEDNNFLNPKLSNGHKNIYLYIFTVSSTLSNSFERYLVAKNGGGSQYGNHLIEVYTPVGGEPTLFFYTKGQQCRVRPVWDREAAQSKDVGQGSISITAGNKRVTGTSTNFKELLDKDIPLKFTKSGTTYTAIVEKVNSDTELILRNTFPVSHRGAWKVDGFGDCHEGDSTFQIYLRSTLTYNTENDDGWTIGGGHMHTNKISENKQSRLVLQAAASDTDKMYYRISSSLTGWNPEADFTVPFNRRKAIKMNGGLGGMTAYGDGWVATVINEASKNNKQSGDGLGIFKVGKNGKMIGNIKWIKPQSNQKPVAVNVATLPNGRILLGWGGTGCDSTCSSDKFELTPTQFYLVELDSNLNFVTPVQTVGNTVGWGEVDAWDSSSNDVVWAYTYVGKPIHPDNTDYADSQNKLSDKLRLITYYNPGSSGGDDDDDDDDDAGTCGNGKNDEGEECEPSLTSSCLDNCKCRSGYTIYVFRDTKYCFRTSRPTSRPSLNNGRGGAGNRGGSAGRSSAEDIDNEEEEEEEEQQQIFIEDEVDEIEEYEDNNDNNGVPGFAIGLIVLAVIIVVLLFALIVIQVSRGY